MAYFKYTYRALIPIYNQEDVAEPWMRGGLKENHPRNYRRSWRRIRSLCGALVKAKIQFDRSKAYKKITVKYIYIICI
jgi:hypothetical protein